MRFYSGTRSDGYDGAFPRWNRARQRGPGGVDGGISKLLPGSNRDTMKL